MTISNVLNSCCNCCNYTPKENPIKNAIHTWYLSSGGETHLIRHDDKIEFLTIQGEEKISDFISLVNIPEVFSSPEDFIECMIEMDPIFDANGKLERTFTKKLHTWSRRYGNPVELVSNVNELYLKTIFDKATVLKKFPALDGLSLKEQVIWIKERHPHVHGRKNKCYFELEEKIKERKSAIDGKTLIDMDHWCVTMLNADSSGVIDSFSPCKWLGHSLLVIETIEEGNYFARQADLTNLDGNTAVRFFELSQPDMRGYVKNYTKSETHGRPKEDIQRMIDQIWRKFCDQKEGEPSVNFKIDGDKRPFWQRFYAINDYVTKDLTKLNEEAAISAFFINCLANAYEENDVANCSKFCVENMEVANIKAYSKYKLSNEVFKTPVLYTRPNVKAFIQEALMDTLQTGLYSGVGAFTAWSVAGLFGPALTLAALPACVVCGPAVFGSIYASSFIGAAFGVNAAVSIGAIGGGLASLSRILDKYSNKENNQNSLNIEPLSLNSINEKAIKPSILKKDE